MSLPTLNVVLFQPEIPQNTGNIGRTCVAIGAKLWLVRPLGFRLDESRLKRAGMDYWDHLDVTVVDDWRQLTEALPTLSMWCFTKTATRLYTNASFSVGDALVFGSESNGLAPSILAIAENRNLRIPMAEQARSLNLACSVAIAAYEAVRQFGLHSAGND